MPWVLGLIDGSTTNWVIRLEQIAKQDAAMPDLSNFSPAKTDTGSGQTFRASKLERGLSVHPIRAVFDLVQRWTSQTRRNCLWPEDSSDEFRGKPLQDSANMVPLGESSPHVGMGSTTARVQRFDRIYKSAGMTHRVEAVIHLEFGGAEAATFWMRKPSDEAIQATLRRRGSLAVKDYQLIEL